MGTTHDGDELTYYGPAKMWPPNDLVRTCSMQVVVEVPYDMRGGADR
jgi:hypothetical protein